MIPSPKVATYDQQPEMNAQGVADSVAETVKSGKYEFVMCNFAPPDMVGHTGDFEAAVKAITATDKAVQTIYDACMEAGYEIAITADHGNAEQVGGCQVFFFLGKVWSLADTTQSEFHASQMLDPVTGNPHTAHTTNPVPFITSFPLVQEKGCLADVAPTILAVMVSLHESMSNVTYTKDGSSLSQFLIAQGLEQPEAMTGKSLLAKN
jgi:2,3-bisphosphoglycerate-independent phosphoglycerate mutase